MIEGKDILDFLRLKKDDFFTEVSLTKLGLFGSFAKNHSAEVSDIDLMIEFEEKAQNLYHKKRALRKLLQEQFNRNVDICREKYLKTYYRDRILQEVIYV